MNKDARPREGREVNGAPDNPLFQDGDQLYDGVIVRLVPEISLFVTSTSGPAQDRGQRLGTRVEPVFLCGQQAAVIAYGQMAKPTFRKEDDYGFITGTGIEAAYGVGKMFKKHPESRHEVSAMGCRNRVFQLGLRLIPASRKPHKQEIRICQAIS